MRPPGGGGRSIPRPNGVLGWFDCCGCPAPSGGPTRPHLGRRSTARPCGPTWLGTRPCSLATTQAGTLERRTGLSKKGLPPIQGLRLAAQAATRRLGRTIRWLRLPYRGCTALGRQRTGISRFLQKGFLFAFCGGTSTLSGARRTVVALFSPSRGVAGFPVVSGWKQEQSGCGQNLSGGCRFFFFFGLADPALIHTHTPILLCFCPRPTGYITPLLCKHVEAWTWWCLGQQVPYHSRSPQRCRDELRTSVVCLRMGIVPVASFIYFTVAPLFGAYHKQADNTGAKNLYIMAVKV